MKNYFNLLSSVQIFKGINEPELSAMLECLGAKKVNAAKGSFLLLAGEKAENVGILLSGSLQIIKENNEGERLILAALEPGQIFAEALCCAGITESPVSVMSTAESEVLLLKFSRILQSCSNSCEFHQKLLGNMLRLLAEKNLLLQGRIDLLGKGSLRSKVMSYLDSFESQKMPIRIPLNREELADFLCVERSALSHELSRMKKDGLIDYRKNEFYIL